MTPSESMMIRAAMFDALVTMCRTDSADADAYVFAYDSLAQVLGIAPVTDFVIAKADTDNIGSEMREALDSLLSVRKVDDNGVD